MRDELKFTVYAWAKIEYWLTQSTEISGFAVSAPDDPLLIVDLIVPAQECTLVSTEIDGDSLAELMESGVTTNIWIHTHPNMSAQPSGQDEKTWMDEIGCQSWAIMAIVSQTGDAYARLRVQHGPVAATQELSIVVDWSAACPAIDPAMWESELADCVSEPTPVLPSCGKKRDKYASQSIYIADREARRAGYRDIQDYADAFGMTWSAAIADITDSTDFTNFK